MANESSRRWVWILVAIAALPTVWLISWIQSYNGECTGLLQSYGQCSFAEHLLNVTNTFCCLISAVPGAIVGLIIYTWNGSPPQSADANSTLDEVASEPSEKSKQDDKPIWHED